MVRTPITILSRKDATERTYTEWEAVVSITDPCSPGYDGTPAPNFHGTPHAIYVRFDDGDSYLIDHREEYRANWGRYPILLSHEAACAIVLFARLHAEAGRSLIVHCEAGVSRSAGVASVLCLLLNGDMACLKAWHRPNALVQATMKRAAGLVPVGEERA